jgi:Toastrack DUF4097
MSEHEEMYADPAEIRHRIGASGQFNLKNVSGDIRLHASDGDEVVVTARSERGRRDYLPLTVHKGEGSLTIDVDKNSFSVFGGWFGNHDGVDFDILVPRMARVEISALSSDVNSRELAGEQSYKTVSGDIQIESEGGRMRVTTVSGDVALRSNHPAEVSLNSTSGDLRVSGAALRAFDARTVSGDVDFRAGLSAGPLHSVETVSGDLSVDATNGVTVEIKKSLDFGRDGERDVVSGDGAAHLRFRTLSGDVRVAGQVRLSRHARKARHDERRVARQMHRHPERFFDLSSMSTPDEETTEFDPFESYEQTQAPDQPEMSQLDVLRALERGDIDIEEASRRLEEATRNA